MKNKVYAQIVTVVTVLVFGLVIVGVIQVSGQEDQPQGESRIIGEQTMNNNQVMTLASTGFTYQGELEDDGQPADGIYDFSFRLLDGPDAGAASQVGLPVEASGVVVSDGIFTVELDFDSSPFNGTALWLEVSVARDGDAFTVLSPAQPLTAVPYALYGEDADSNPANEYNTNLVLSGTTLQISDAGGTHSQDLSSLVNDADADPTNEYNTNLVLSGTTLQISDAGGTHSQDLSSLVDDADADPMNEFNTGINFTGTTLQITDGGGMQTQDIGTFDGNLIITANGRLGVRTAAPITDLQIVQSDGALAGTGGATFSRGTNWKIMHTGAHFSFVENNVRRSYVEAGTGNYVITSDEAMKKNIEPLGSVLNGVLQLEPVQFQYLTQSDDAVKTNGFIAQDVGEIFPELARTAEDGTLGLAYTDFGVLAIAAIQEQQTQIEALKLENEALRTEIDEIHSMLAQGNDNTAGTEPSNFQYASFTTTNSSPGNPQTASLFSGTNLALLILSGIVMVLLWNNREQKDGIG